MLSDLCRRLKPIKEIETVLSAAFLSRSYLVASMVQIGEGAVGWALEKASNALIQIKKDFSAVPDLPNHEIGASLETLILDILVALVAPSSERLTVKMLPPMARQAARHQVPFGDVVKSMRKNQSRWITDLLSEFSAEQLATTSVQQLFTAASSVVDDAVGQFVETYLNEREALMEGQIARRRALVESLITGELSLDAASVEGIKADLDIELNQFHTGLVITHTERSPRLALPNLQRDLRGVVPGSTVLTVAADHHHTWIWISTPEKPSPNHLNHLCDVLAKLSGVRCALAEPFRGIRGFRQTHLQANDLSSISTYLPGKGVLRWADHVLTTILGQDQERAGWFVHSTLGPLADSTIKAEEQRQTLQAYFDASNSLLHAAEVLGIHRNTVVYRLQQIELCLNKPVRICELELRCALHLTTYFGSKILRPAEPPSTP
ncbi:PucR family transcriptional regulator [Pseudomonas syringae]|uniref:PucR family transcriptional regulator n=1 Tax=Pseudomonas syringae TaxID=317 RepID=UPI001F28E291|nr:helix-turn-helix domain-containing protein [Pseudomonas syringae]MCF5725453.1 hypothetical protein [Pseudomonas syringae]